MNGEVRDIIRDIRFIDSFRFMQFSLSSLVDNLPSPAFKNLAMKGYDAKRFTLLRRKGVFPYDWFDSFENFKETKLPPKDDFYSRLSGSHITDEDYQHAQDVWKEFEILNMREYHDLYLETDILLLADVFENFRDVAMEHYGLDPAWYYSTPGLSWDAMLKKTKIKLELL